MICIDLFLNILGSLALATETPAEDILSRGPFNWNEYIITPFMRITIIFQIFYGVASLITLFFLSNNNFSSDKMLSDKIKTMIFTSLVFLIIFNQINSRKIKRNDYNVFKGILHNKIFLFMIFLMVFLQILLVNYGGKSFECYPLSFEDFMICIGIGFGSLIVGLLARIIPENLFENISFLNESKKLKNEIEDRLEEKLIGKKRNVFI